MAGEPGDMRSWTLRDDRSAFDEESLVRLQSSTRQLCQLVNLTMSTKIHIPTPLRPFTGKQDVVEVDGATVGELLGHLTSKHEGLKKHLYNDEGRLRSFVNIYLNDEDIRYLDREADAGEARRHAQHHPFGRRRRRRGRGAAA